MLFLQMYTHLRPGLLQVAAEKTKEISSDTRSISLIAAKRRTRMNTVASTGSLSRAKERSLISVQSLEEADESDGAASEPQRTPLTTGVRPAVSSDSLAVYTPIELDPKRRSRRLQGSSRSSSKKDPHRGERRNIPIERRARKKRSKSFEANAKWVSFWQQV